MQNCFMQFSLNQFAIPRNHLFSKPQNNVPLISFDIFLRLCLLLQSMSTCFVIAIHACSSFKRLSSVASIVYIEIVLFRCSAGWVTMFYGRICLIHSLPHTYFILSSSFLCCLHLCATYSRVALLGRFSARFVVFAVVHILHGCKALWSSPFEHRMCHARSFSSKSFVQMCLCRQ